ncbi:hypothetical protein [Streptomyces sp. BK022]|uniref:hypothetical protein n=1 Tax=Streptomyces sp. BK022 TaxID=2512123 RepID=UPI001F5E6603|nr:hypothetical protein [Streptomyces sp. BK022]
MRLGRNSTANRVKGLGIVPPNGIQAEATLEAPHDVDIATRPLAEAGTTHRCQGWEFDVVVFDMMEGDCDSRELWMALTHRHPGADP